MDGQEACEMVMSRDVNYYDIIILDIDMPVMNGMDACEELTSWIQERKLEKFDSNRRKGNKEQGDDE